jgi:hypothetical protein
MIIIKVHCVVYTKQNSFLIKCSCGVLPFKKKKIQNSKILKILISSFFIIFTREFFTLSNWQTFIYLFWLKLVHSCPAGPVLWR